MLAGTKETPGEVFVNEKGENLKEYRGMASKEAQREWRGKSSTPEGVSAVVPYKGPVDDILKDLRGGICSGLSYTGANTIKELHSKRRFILQSSAAQLESNTHILWRK
jgi:IMP dehydrogenase